MLSDAGSEEFRTSYMQGAKTFVASFRQILAQQKRDETGTSIADELLKLAQLTKEGILSAEDFERGKDLFLGKPPDKQEQALSLLRNLHSLHQSGVLSQSEFNMKKWDVLSKPSL